MDRASELQRKEVINVSDGKRLGFVYDVEVDLMNGTVGAIIVPAQNKVLGIFGKEDDYIIPWEDIKKIGDDIILVELAQKRSDRRKY